MKKLKVAMFAVAFGFVAVPFFQSCSDMTDDSAPTDNSGIAKTYGLTAFNIPTAQDINGDGTPSSNLLSETDCYNGNYLKLNSDHTYKKVDNFLDLSSGTPTCSDFTETGVWKMSGDTIITTSSESNGYVSYDLKYLYNSGTLTNTIEEGEYPGLDDFGFPTTLVGTINYVFSAPTE